MTKELVHTPKQTRSQNTQERVLRALEEMLSERFFEQITIRDLAARTGVASGTIYRRFKDKEALLPVLYERFDHKLRNAKNKTSGWQALGLLQGACSDLAYRLFVHASAWRA